MLLLPEGQTGEAWEPYKKQCSYFHFSIGCGHKIRREGGLDTKTDSQLLIELDPGSKG